MLVYPIVYFIKLIYPTSEKIELWSENKDIYEFIEEYKSDNMFLAFEFANIAMENDAFQYDYGEYIYATFYRKKDLSDIFPVFELIDVVENKINTYSEIISNNITQKSYSVVVMGCDKWGISNKDKEYLDKQLNNNYYFFKEAVYSTLEGKPSAIAIYLPK